MSHLIAELGLHIFHRGVVDGVAVIHGKTDENGLELFLPSYLLRQPPRLCAEKPSSVFLI